MADAPSAVTVVVPAYRPDQRLVSTLESVRAQTYAPVDVLLSMDYAPGHLPPPLPAMSNMTVIEQPRRLGWVAHVNALLPRVRTPLFMILGHDDRITPQYIERCVHLLSGSPGAVVAHGAVRYFGLREGEAARTDSITGAPFDRVMEYIRRGPHQAELGWRGVARTSVLPSGLRLRTRRSDGMFSNTLWALELLLHGESRACQTEYYEKHTAPDGLSRLYHGRSLEERSTMLADNVACLADVVLSAGFEAEELQHVVAAYVEWLLALQGHWNVVADEPSSDRVPYARVRPALSHFVAATVLAAAGAPAPEVPIPVGRPGRPPRGHDESGGRRSRTRGKVGMWLRSRRSTSP